MIMLKSQLKAKVRMAILQFFQVTDAKDSEYRNLREQLCLQEMRQRVEEDWQLYCQLGLQDPGNKQLNEAKKNFHGVFWEMYLARILYEQGYHLKKVGSRKAGGPDYSFEYQGKMIHIEATVSTSGQEDKPDSLREVILYKNDIGEVIAPNEYGLLESRTFILRLTQSLQEKFNKYQGYLSNNVIASDSCCVIAINGNKISSFIEGSIGLPYIYQALFGIGDPVITWDRDAPETSKLSRQSTPNIYTSNGSPVSTSYFREGQEIFQIISGVLYSNADVANRNKSLLFIPNPNAKNPIPEGVRFYSEY